MLSFSEGNDIQRIIYKIKCMKLFRFKDKYTRIRYSTIETKEATRIGYNGFLFPHSYSGDGRTSFVSIIMYLTCTIIVLLKKNGMTFNSTTILKLIY